MRICVFCGSAAGNDPVYAAGATALADLFAANDIGLVYGGARVGLMGHLADAALARGVEVTGVMPRQLWASEIGHEGLTRLHLVDSLHERKAAMAERADAFIALPGGTGTLEELIEQWTWAQLGIHSKPCGLLNISGYFDPFLEMARHMVDKGFLAPAYADMLLVEPDSQALLARLKAYRPPPVKWRAGWAEEANRS